MFLFGLKGWGGIFASLKKILLFVHFSVLSLFHLCGYICFTEPTSLEQDRNRVHYGFTMTSYDPHYLRLTILVLQ